MNYQRELPTEVGYYWLLDEFNILSSRIVEVYKGQGNSNLFITKEEHNIDIRDECYKNCLWAGPLQPPKHILETWQA